MTWSNRWYWQWILSGLLMGIGFVVSTIWPLGLVGGALFIYLLEQETSLSHKFIGAWLSWTIKAAFSVGWYWSTYPIEWLPVEVGQIQLFLVFFTWFMTAVCLGSGALVFVSFVQFLRSQMKWNVWVYLLLLYPLLWVVSESIGSLAFSFFFNGPGGTLNTSFSFGYVGYLLAGNEILLQPARIAGVYGLSAVFILLAGSMVWFSRQDKKTVSVALIVFISVYLIGSSTWTQPTKKNNDGYSVVAIDTKLDSKIRASEEGYKQAEDVLAEAMRAALALEPDYIIFPEDSRFFDQTRPVSSVKSLFQVQYGDPKVVIVDSGRATHRDKTVLQALIYNGPEDSMERFHKRYLVPIGEYFPSVYSYGLRATGFKESLQYLSQDISYQIGPWTDQGSASSNVPGILFCFESFAPQGVRQLMREHKDMPFVAHIASHAWFHEPYTLWSQMESMMRVQAMWNQQYLISVGNMMSGKLYTPNGTINEIDTIAKGERWTLKQVFIPK